MKQRKPPLGRPLSERPAPAEVPILADAYLHEIMIYEAQIKEIEARAGFELDAVKKRYDGEMTLPKIRLAGAITALMQTMKFNKNVLFDGTDVVRLVNGSLIHSTADKVSIPRDALAKCEELGFDEVIKIAKSLDRDAVEKWPDERLVLIGAERKQKEEFSYDLKREATA